MIIPYTFTLLSIYMNCVYHQSIFLLQIVKKTKKVKKQKNIRKIIDIVSNI